jgi:hypothetical protein
VLVCAVGGGKRGREGRRRGRPRSHNALYADQTV